MTVFRSVVEFDRVVSITSSCSTHAWLNLAAASGFKKRASACFVSGFAVGSGRIHVGIQEVQNLAWRSQGNGTLDATMFDGGYGES